MGDKAVYNHIVFKMESSSVVWYRHDIDEF